MDRECVKARILRAVSQKTQEQVGAEVGVHPSLITQFEAGKAVPSAEQMEKLAGAAGLTADDGEQMMRLYEVLSAPRRRPGRSLDDLLDRMADDIDAEFRATLERVLALAIAEEVPRAEDRAEGEELFARLTAAPQDQWITIVEVAEEFHFWAVCERICQETETAIAARDLDRALALAVLGWEIAERVSGPQGWSERLRGYAAGCAANVYRARGESGMAKRMAAEAEQLWSLGSDPAGLLEPRYVLAANY